MGRPEDAHGAADAGRASSSWLTPTSTPRAVSSIEMQMLSPSSPAPRTPRAESMQSLIEKPLPSPGAWSQISMRKSRLQYGATKRLKCIGLGRLRVPRNGFRATIGAGTVVAAGAAGVNLAMLIWASTRPWDSPTGTRTLTEGNCDQMRNTFTYSHLFINILSTVLLGTSNFTMQCLSAPTRKAIDRAHAEGRFLDVGISGFRNWPHMDRWRQWCWMLLLISTIPLHLLYNSVIFSTTTANEYYALAMPSNFLDNQVSIPTADSDLQSQILYNMTQLARQDKLVKMDNSDCLGVYSNQLVTGFSNVLAVTKNVSNTMPLLSFEVHSTPATGSTVVDKAEQVWLCTGTYWSPCDMDWVTAHPQNWNFTMQNVTVDDNGSVNKFEMVTPIDHCLLQPTETHCTVQFIPEIMIIVIACNVIKVGCFLVTLRMRSFKPLITLGDAMDSFLNNPEPETFDLGPVSAADIRDAEARSRVGKLLRRHKNDYSPGLLGNSTHEHSRGINKLPLRFGEWKARPKRWFSGASRLRWNLTYALMVTLWLVGWSFFGIAQGSSNDSYASQWTTGLGNVAPDSLIEATAPVGVFGNVILANIFQLLVSLTYVSYNGLLTCILLSHEFTKYSQRRRGLRVSTPVGHYQRNSYWLSLPYYFGIPLLILSGFLHWALSQALFLAEINVNGPDGHYDALYSVSCLGFSSLALLMTMIFGSILIISPLLLGWIRYKPGAPLVESNSICISAACHPLGDASGEAVQLLKYGVLPCTDNQRVSLTSDSVAPLIPGNRHTSRSELDATALSALSQASIPEMCWQKQCEYVLIFLHVVKWICFVMFFVSTLIPRTSEMFINVGIEIFMLIINSLMGLYLLVRGITSCVRRRKKWRLRRFGWHVVPEAIFWLIWAIILGLTSGYRGFYDAEMNELFPAPAVNYMAAISAGNMLAFQFSLGIEVWLWAQQHYPGFNPVATLQSQSFSLLVNKFRFMKGSR